MKQAIIDLGTNTFNLLIGELVDGKLNVFVSTKEAVLLGMGGINDGKIADDALHRAKETLLRFKQLCNDENVHQVLGIGTAAMRDAENVCDLTYWAEQELGFKIKIISGKEEADLIFRGVSLLCDFEKPGIIMDIGGGSNEFIYANQYKVLKAQSFDIGVSRIYQMLGEPDEFSAESQQKVQAFFEAETKGFFDGLQVSHLIGASGSFETIYEMMFKERFPEDHQLKVLPVEDVYRIINWSISASLEERMNNPWIVPMRKKMLPIAAFSILWVMKKLNTERFTICPFSLKEGAFTLE